MCSQTSTHDAKEKQLYAWDLARAISPRRTVRVAPIDAYGIASGSYALVHPVEGDQPADAAPWAVHLTDRDGDTWLLGLDLDDRAGTDPVADAQAVCELLDAADIDHVVCASGGGRGRHIWGALCEPASPELIRHVATALTSVAPSLDTAPLLNPHAGCLRSPGAPHRHGGASTVIAGSVEALIQPRTTVAQIQTLLALIPEPDPEPPTAMPRAIATDTHGHPYLPGQRRALPPQSVRALHTDPTADPTIDASAVQWKVLLGAARARWRFSDVAAELDTAPGLEASRTRRGRGSLRIPRTDPRRRLAADWRRAVATVATSTQNSSADDSSFCERAGDTAAVVEATQQRADASPGRWTSGPGPADRRTLDALCVIALEAVTSTIDIDIRRLALRAGIGRETARTALHRLSADGWITRTRTAAGAHAATWKIAEPADFHTPPRPDRSQADTRAARRSQLLVTLRQRLHRAAHDAFTPRALGLHAGTVWARLHEDRPHPHDHAAHQLLSAGLITSAGEPRDVRDRVATAHTTSGTLERRAIQYEVERAVWQWWCAEVAWMTAPGRNRRYRPRQGRLVDIAHPWERWHPYPRGGPTGHGRGRHQWAAAAVRNGSLPVTQCLHYRCDNDPHDDDSEERGRHRNLRRYSA